MSTIRFAPILGLTMLHYNACRLGESDPITRAGSTCARNTRSGAMSVHVSFPNRVTGSRRSHSIAPSRSGSLFIRPNSDAYRRDDRADRPSKRQSRNAASVLLGTERDGVFTRIDAGCDPRSRSIVFDARVAGAAAPRRAQAPDPPLAGCGHQRRFRRRAMPRRNWRGFVPLP
jgi:hypothetical protein